MNEDDLRQLFELANKREEKKYEWLKWLILLASGTFTILTSFQTAKPDTQWVTFFMKLSWIGLGSGILFGAFALYGEVYTLKEMTRKIGLELQKEREQRLPVTAGPTRIQRIAETACYLSLVSAVISMMIYALIKT